MYLTRQMGKTANFLLAQVLCLQRHHHHLQPLSFPGSLPVLKSPILVSLEYFHNVIGKMLFPFLKSGTIETSYTMARFHPTSGSVSLRCQVGAVHSAHLTTEQLQNTLDFEKTKADEEPL